MFANRDRVLTMIFGHEGTFSNRSKKDDPGGATMYGVTAAVLGRYRHLGRDATAQEVANLTKAEAITIMADGYLKPVRFDDLPSGVDYAMADCSVNSGPGKAVKLAQQVVGVRQDGVIGQQTLRAIALYGATRFVHDYCAARLAFMRGLKNWSANKNGWTTRVKTVEKIGTQMASAMRAPDHDTSDDVVASAGGDAKADPIDTKVTATATGQGAATSAIGLLTTGVSEGVDKLQAPLQPLIGTLDFVGYVCTGLTVVGAAALVVGLMVTFYGQFKAIGAGAAA